MTPALLLAFLLATVVPLPGGPPMGIDQLAYEPTTNRIWVPVSNTGDINVVDVATGKVTTLGGFPTAPPREEGRLKVGPSAATAGDGRVWVSNRADRTILAFDAKTMKFTGRGSFLATVPDSLAYVAFTREIWVTIPDVDAIEVLGTGDKVHAPTRVSLEGKPEGHAVDDARGLFYTNLEDQDQTLALDVKTRMVVARLSPACGAKGPRGLALDGARRLLFFACTDGAGVFDLAHEGKVVGRVKTGGGVNQLAYDMTRRLLFVAAATDAKMTVAHVADSGALDIVATVATAPGARNPILDARGTVYLPDGRGGQLLVFGPDAFMGKVVPPAGPRP